MMQTRNLRLIVIVAAILIGIVFAGRVAAERLAEAKKHAAAYALACEGKPLRTADRRNKALEDGYQINNAYDCIDKASFAAVTEKKRRWDTDNTPAERARRAKIQAAHDAENAALQSLAAMIQPPPPDSVDVTPEIPHRVQDANVATESDLAVAFGLSPEMATQIVVERIKRPFRDWPDLIARVPGLQSARNAAFATIGGLTVNGEPMPGGPPDAQTIALARDSLRKGKRSGQSPIQN